MRLLVTLLFASIPLSLSADERILSLLAGYEWQVETVDWRQQDVETLARISRDDTEKLFIRKRALSALGFLRSSESQRALAEMISEGRQMGMRRRAIDEICEMRQSEQSLNELFEVLIPALEESDEQLRFRAASCLRDFSTIQRVADALDRYYLRARDWERQELNRN